MGYRRLASYICICIQKGFVRAKLRRIRRKFEREHVERVMIWRDWGRKEIEGDAGPLTSRFLNSSKGPPNSEG